jgi:putative colanic acid biosysnthesis UDP-glucose lipid carrier transferase
MKQSLPTNKAWSPYAEPSVGVEQVNSFMATLAEVIPLQSSPPIAFFPLDQAGNRAAKRCLDWLMATLLIVGVLSWLIPLVGLMIKLSSRGPVFFVQRRVKRGGRLFSCIKFRTMVPNKEADRTPAGVNDPRITRLGQFLRRHHIDELPQLFNVWWGDMSLIGPRPYMIHDDKVYSGLVEGYGLRYQVKPGITGLAQSLGYYGLLQDSHHLHERVALDLEYIRFWSARMDWQIAWRTIRLVWRTGEAEVNKQSC